MTSTIKTVQLGRPKKDESEKVKRAAISVHVDTAERFRRFYNNNDLPNHNDALIVLLEAAEEMDLFKTSLSDDSSSKKQRTINNEDDSTEYLFSETLTAKEDYVAIGNQHNKSPSGSRNADIEEAEHFDKIVDTFLYYKIYSLDKLKRELLSYKHLPKHHQQMIPRYVDHMSRIRQCILANFQILKLVVKNVGNIFENQQKHDVDDPSSTMKRRRHWPASDFNMEKLQSTLRQFVRDWSSDGYKERKICYGTVMNDIERLWPTNRENIRILVPGAGLGRLAFEIAKLGYICEGNEFSLFMLFCSNFILNRCKSANCFTLYPWIHQWTNNLTYEDQVRPVLVPDVDPCSSMLTANNFSMSAGDFMQIYSSNDSKNSWDGVVTVFFIDTARNVLAYVEKIYDLLKPGGYWINLGPLLYHFASSSSYFTDDDSIQLPYNELKEASQKIGFVFVNEMVGLETTYTENAKSLLKYKYECVKFICLKPQLDIKLEPADLDIKLKPDLNND